MDIKATGNKIARSVLFGLLLATALFTSGCGGGDGEAAPTPRQAATGPGPLDEGGIVCELAAVLFGGECVGVGNLPSCSDDPFGNPLGLPDCNDPVTSGLNEGLWITPLVYGMDDVEPNDSISMAAPASLYSQLPGGRGGFLVKSTFDTVTDPVDVFIFTLQTSANIEFTLCFGEVGCRNNSAARIDVGIAYINLLDQNGTLIWSAAEDIQSGNLKEIWLDAGVPYYVELVAADTMGSEIAYRFGAVEAQSQVMPVAVPVADEQEDEQPDPTPMAPLLMLSGASVTPDNMTFTLDWVPPVESVDGTALLDLSGYRIHYGAAATGTYPGVITLDNPGLTSFVIDVPIGEYGVVMTALTAAGLESDFSNEVVMEPGPMGDE
jgi:hypothetical protein